MKRWWKLLLAAVLVLALVLAGLAWRQQENLKAVRDALRYSQEELEQQLADNQQTIRDAVDAAPEVSVREVTDEERQALRDGTVTREELIESLLNTEGTEAAGEPPVSSTVPEQPVETAKPVELPKPAEQAYQRELSALIAKVYVLRERHAQFVASDCHDTVSRPPDLGPAAEVLTRKLGEKQWKEHVRWADGLAAESLSSAGT